MESNFLVQTQVADRAMMLTVSGELDLVSSPALEQALEDLSATDTRLVMIDMRQLDFMDSTGIHLLVKAQQRAHAAGQRFAVIRGSEQVQRLLDLTGVSEQMTIVDSPEELLDDNGPAGAP
jgi:anti-sigma B factor antagonist